MRRNRVILIAAFIVCSMQLLTAATLRGIVVDEMTGQPLLGATVMVQGSAIGTATGLDGSFEIHVDNKIDTETAQPLVISYISYITQEVSAKKGDKDIKVLLVPDTKVLASVQVVTRKNLETETALQNERIASNVAIESIGMREMSLKGLSTVEDGVKKMTGISIANAGQIIVRGLGDRYSLTTLNGLPIASPNPDNKLAPLDIFPSMAVKNITVSKVYDASSYADYSGAHIDIATKELVGDNFFSFGVGVGADFSTIGSDFYKMDNVSLLSMPSYDKGVENASSFSDYVGTNDIFDTDFNVAKSTGLPSFSANIGYGHSYDIGNHKLSVLLTGGVDNNNESMTGAMYKSLSATGGLLKANTSDKYTSSLDIAALASVGMTINRKDHIAYTLFYARNASNEYSYNYDGLNEDKNINYETSNNISRIYGMMTNQLNGSHNLSDKLRFLWSGAYTTTSSDEPDNRQTLLRVDEDGEKHFYSDSGDETNRYFTELDETEYSANAAFEFKFLEDQSVKVGVAYKDKTRDFGVTKFMYNMRNLMSDDIAISSIYDLDGYISLDNIQSDLISLTMMSGSTSQYDAGSSVMAAFATTTLNLGERVLLDFGLRLESSEQFVNYETAYGFEPETSTLDAVDIFPSLNIRYAIAEKRLIRFAASKTITRPSFLEMAPYEYRESYGAPIIKGNEDIENGYNYNVDLRYEGFFDGGDMFSVTAYYKFLDHPIERITESRSGAVLYSFANVDDGYATGVEFETRKMLAKNFRLGLNGSYMYTKVNLQSGGNYTNDERELQGASPYLLNADLTFTPKISDKQLSLALLYNLQGPRIHAVGIYDSGDIMQRAVNTLNFTASYEVSDKVKVSAKLSNLLAMDYVFDQYMPLADQTYVVERYNPGVSGDISVSFKF